MPGSEQSDAGARIDRGSGIRHRAYLSVRWLLVALAIMAPLLHLAVFLHDRLVVSQDFACHDRETALEVEALKRPQPSNIPGEPVAMWSEDLARRCGIAADIEPGSPIVHSETIRSTRAWEWSLARRPSPAQDKAYLLEAGAASALASIPLVVLVLGRRWLRWLLGAGFRGS